MTQQYASTTQAALNGAIASHRLPGDFGVTVDQYYWPVADYLGNCRQSNMPLLVGIQGAQGSGKSTLASFLKLLLEQEFGLRVLIASIDDFYLQRKERIPLSETVHPLFITRGVPGTHDVDLLDQFLKNVVTERSFKIPRFDKATDDRAAKAEWQHINYQPDIVILEGWCVGIRAQSTRALKAPINQLERQEDPDGRWRTLVNEALLGPYLTIFQRLDRMIVLQAPSFACVHDWRLLQEEKLVDQLQAEGKSTGNTLSPDEVSRFISHYQRLTEHALSTLPAAADCLLRMKDDHSFAELRINQE
ncbi:MAG: phosphoribulokinase [Pseudomonadota bacterium]